MNGTHGTGDTMNIKVVLPLADLADSFKIGDGDVVDGKSFNAQATMCEYGVRFENQLTERLKAAYPDAEIVVEVPTNEIGSLFISTDASEGATEIEENIEYIVRSVSESLWNDDEAWACYDAI